MIDYEGLPAPKEYYDGIGTVITPETWFEISGIEYAPALMPRRTPAALAKAAEEAFRTKRKDARKNDMQRLEKGAWIWVAQASGEAAAVQAVAIAMSSLSEAAYTDTGELTASLASEKPLSAHTGSQLIDSLCSSPTLVVAGVGDSHLPEEADALLELMEKRWRQKRATIFASAYTGKTISRALVRSGANTERTRELVDLVSKAIRSGRQS